MNRKLIIFFIQGVLLFFLAGIYFLTARYFAQHPQRTDFVRFYISCRYLLKGEDIYTPVTNRDILSVQHDEMDESTLDKIVPQNLNSPLHTLFLAPLAFFHFQTAFWIWSIFSYSCGLIAALLVAARSFKSRTPALVLGLWILLFAYFPTFVTAYLGQFSLTLLLLISLIWMTSRERRDYAAGAILGIAVSLKVFLGLFLLFFVLLRRWRLVLTSFASAILLNFLAATILGFQPYFDYLKIIANLPWHDSSWNPSLAGFFVRVFSRSAVTSLSSAPAIATAVIYCSSLILLAGICYLALRPEMPRCPDNFDLGFSLTLIAMLLISPYGWIYYFTALMIPLMVAWRLGAKLRKRSLFRFFLALAWFLSAVPTAFMRSDEAHLKSALVVYLGAGIYFYALIAFVLIIGYLKLTLSTLHKSQGVAGE